MAIVITNGNYYIWYTSTGATKKVSDINLAYQFPTVTDAINTISETIIGRALLMIEKIFKRNK